MKRFHKFLTLSVIFALLLLTGCKSGGDNSDSTGDLTKRIEFEAVTDVVEGRKNIYAVLKVITGDYWQGIVSGLTEAGNDLGCNVYVGGPSTEAGWEIQEDMLKEAYDKQADAIIFAPGNSSAFEETMNMFRKKDIPIILVDTMLTSAYYDVCYMTDNFQAGQLAAEELISMLEAKGYGPDDEVNVAIQVSTKNSQTVVDRIAGFNKYWYINTPQSWRILDDIKCNLGEPDMAVQNGHDFLGEYPDLKAVVACNNSSAVGFAKALVEENRNDIILSAFDYSENVASLIADENWTAATVVQKQRDMGINGVKTALDLINGGSCPYKFVDTGVVVINERNYEEYESGK